MTFVIHCYFFNSISWVFFLMPPPPPNRSVAVLVAFVTLSLVIRAIIPLVMFVSCATRRSFGLHLMLGEAKGLGNLVLASNF